MPKAELRPCFVMLYLGDRFADVNQTRTSDEGFLLGNLRSGQSNQMHHAEVNSSYVIRIIVNQRYTGGIFILPCD